MELLHYRIPTRQRKTIYRVKQDPITENKFKNLTNFGHFGKDIVDKTGDFGLTFNVPKLYGKIKHSNAPY